MYACDEQAHAELFDHLKTSCNRVRLQSSLGESPRSRSLHGRLTKPQLTQRSISPVEDHLVQGYSNLLAIALYDRRDVGQPLLHHLRQL